MRRTLFLPLALAAVLPMTFSAALFAQEVPETLAQSLSVNGQAMPVEKVSATPLEGIYQVRLTSGESFYTNADGSHFVVGDLYENSEQGLINLTEQARNQERVAVLESVPESERVIFRGLEAPKATVTVFTDTSCPYCSRLHETVPELNERGIAVHYLAFPRAGMQSDAARVMQQVWCADNPSEAMTAAKEGEALSGSASCDNPVASQYDLGLEIGVEGTPAIILPDGQMVPGFVPPERLAAMLGLDNE